MHDLRGIIPDIKGMWRVYQLSPELQDVVNNNLAYFNGLEPNYMNEIMG